MTLRNGDWYGEWKENKWESSCITGCIVQQDLAVAGIVVGGTGFALGVVAAVLYILLFSSGGGVPDWENSTDTALMAIRNMIWYF